MAIPTYDALIVGAGAAGLSAALGLSRVHRLEIVLTKPRNAGFRNQGAEEMHNVLSRDCTPPAEFRRIAEKQILKYGTTEFVEAEITSLRRIEVNNAEGSSITSYFEAADSDGRRWHGRKVILATGSIEILPTNIPGYKENWPQNINGPIPDTEPMLKALDTVKTLGCKIETAKIDRLVAAESPEVGVIVYLTDGRSTHVGYLADRPTTVLSSRNLVLQLGLEIESHPFMGEQIKDVELDGTTRVPGVFVAGDAVTPLKSAPNAISSGSNAAAVVVQHLMAEDLQIRLASCPT